ncbi:restriction endonuclease fold toxin 5 domain-containing protein [Hyalangium rubrum]|uniref:Restriction endonuclease fold toxin 5 domain-containing protein n=1 Tax=Hyalangium rubrum TaxID=3103134 RepID=A0ABU5HJ52_9BACT|nr:restriction endonuclease fold toxin 5 domain-containing protein [Hyalangium sp. s54d21]MDY7232120.1 restriction endonuclease fold toxin 5 domain-containing protein [Hyalangium sp. s54d21]
MSEAQFKQAVAAHAPAVPAVERPLEHARQLLGVPERSGWYRYEGRNPRLIPSAPGNHQDLRLLPADDELKSRYLLWCARTWAKGDCLRLLVDSPSLDGDAKYALAMAIAQSHVLGAMKEELAQMVSPQAVVATIVSGLTMYAILLALPEPVTKGVAALLTLGAVAYLGWDTVWRLVDGWLVLMKEVDRATTFDELQASGEKFAGVMGQKAARAFVMLATVAMGNTAAGMATTLPKLPGAGQAAGVARAQLNIHMTAPALAQVESVAISAEGVTIALAPNAVAMAAPDSRGSQGDAKAVLSRSQGPGEWGHADESMSEQARRYQAQVTGAPEGYVYRVKVGDKSVKFDGFDGEVLLETKSTGYAQWLNKKLDFFGNFEGRDQMLEQARRQLRAARGTPIRWVVAEEKLAGALRKVFQGEGLPIEVIHVPPDP